MFHTAPVIAVLIFALPSFAQDDWQSFYRRCVVGREKPEKGEVEKAQAALQSRLNHAGIYCLDPGGLRIRIQTYADIQQRQLKIDRAHELCHLAERLYTRGKVGVVLCYSLARALDGSHQAEYSWEDAEIQLPTDIWERILTAKDAAQVKKILAQDPGFQYALTQHQIHEQRRRKIASPYHGTVSEVELARLPAIIKAVKTLADQLNKKKPQKKSIDQIKAFLRKGETLSRAALTELTQLDAGNAEFETDTYDDLVWAEVGDATFYIATASKTSLAALLKGSIQAVRKHHREFEALLQKAKKNPAEFIAAVRKL